MGAEVSEESERVSPGPEGNGAGADPAALALALGFAAQNERVAAKAEAYLESQKRLSDLQTARLEAQDRHFREEAELELSHLRLRRFSGWAKAIFEASVGLLAVAALCGLGITVWDAAHADGLVIEEFSVPPDLAAKGMTGQAVASLMLDKLTTMQNATASFRPAKSYSNNWGNDLKVEIPDTGVSLGEAYRFLRGWLGHETRISGEVYWIDKNIAINVRATGGSGATLTGPGSDLDALVQKASEKVYGDSQPYRYANYLYHYAQVPRPQEAKAIFNRLIADPNPLEQAWAWTGLSQIYSVIDGNDLAAFAALRKAIAVYPDFPLGHANLSGIDMELGHDEAALAEKKVTQQLLVRTSVPEIRSDLLGYMRTANQASIAELLGDYAQTENLAAIALGLANNRDADGVRRMVATALAKQHDGAAALAYFAELPPPPFPFDKFRRPQSRLQIDYALENWGGVLASEGSVERNISEIEKAFNLKVLISNGPRLWLAVAKAKTGDNAGAQSLLAATRGDCYDCMRTRGLIAATAKQWGRADYWFAHAVHDAPSIPIAYEDWGRSLLVRGKPNEAIAQFTASNKKGPHFADPLEGWGEALMAKNQSDLALAKFTEAEKYAPNWGRLHLKWGEALFYAGKRDEAKSQFVRAAALDLTPSEKFELARHP